MLRVNAINRQELLKCLTFNPKSLVFKTVSVPSMTIAHGIERAGAHNGERMLSSLLF